MSTPAGGSAHDPSRHEPPDATIPVPDRGGHPEAVEPELDLQHELQRLAEEEKLPAAGPWSNLAAALVVCGVGIAAVSGALALGVGTARQPGPGTFPLLIGGLLVVLGAVLAVLSRRTADTEEFSRASLLVLAGLVTMVVFVAVIERVGFEVPAALLTFVWLRFIGRESWRLSVVVSLLVVAAFYAVFVGALAVPIPHLF
ncbi:tripartite tricarboxylate transporter TctB family protein [Kineococcus sp. SYSU DK003]|uniref:tripartite tricarboxylate transporter TctB family protein n=1 Tax=Kineococcus sp. SYSU DK003 TaxID=3383124 RepID=UPI003D7E5303